jgi:hypothetical protein
VEFGLEGDLRSVGVQIMAASSPPAAIISSAAQLGHSSPLAPRVRPINPGRSDGYWITKYGAIKIQSVIIGLPSGTHFRTLSVAP